MAWSFYTKLKNEEKHGASETVKELAKVLSLEIARLAKQKCAYCDGFGHSGNDCPTDRKLDQLRGGVREQTLLIQLIRKACRKDAGMADKTGFSLLSARLG